MRKLMHSMNDLINLSRRRFLTRGTSGVGVAALASLFADSGCSAADGVVRGALNPSGEARFVPAAKRVIYLFQSGGPSQMDLFDYKPAMQSRFNQELPERVRKGQRITTMTSRQKRFPIAPSMFRFQQHGESGAWLSELLPHTAAVSDQICFVKTMVTQAINHDPG